MKKKRLLQAIAASFLLFTAASCDITVTQPSSTGDSGKPETNIDSTNIPSISIPSTVLPSTSIPSTVLPSTSVPTTSVPSISIPTTNIPSTNTPSTEGNTTTNTPSGPSTAESDIKIIKAEGHLESMWATFKSNLALKSFEVYYKAQNASTFTKADKELIRKYNDYFRVDIPGLKAGSYDLKIVPTVNGDELEYTLIESIKVSAHDRSGFAFLNGSSSGAYNDDGTLKSNARVLYVSNQNKDTVALDVLVDRTTTKCVGIQNIITAYKKGTDKRPLCIRFIGNIEDPANMAKGDLYIDSFKSGLTLEGIGDDATINGFGVVVKGSQNVEIRNLGFMNCDSTEGDSISLQQDNRYVWVHNNDIFYGMAGSDSDQAKGDGALDTKTSTMITHSYNHFWDSGKSNLQGMKSETVDNFITYHHNWYDHSDSRHPRIRTCTVHIYNNYFDGNAKYGVGVTLGASAFVESNYFRSDSTMKPMLSSLQGTDIKGGTGTFSNEDGGIIKSFNNKFDGKVLYIPHTSNSTSFDAYEASSRDEVVPSTYKALSGSSTYNNFDTASTMYKYIVESPEDAKETVKKYAGRINGGDFKYSFDGKNTNKRMDQVRYKLLVQMHSMVLMLSLRAYWLTINQRF